MSEDIVNLSSLQIDALKEIGNVGAGNAATSLAVLINRRVEMTVPRVSIVLLTRLWDLIGEAEELVSAILLRVAGPAPASIVFMLSHQNAMLMADMLLGRSPGATRQLGEIEQSALKELGNILTGTYLSALNRFTGLEFSPSVPMLAIDMLAAVISSLVSPLAEVGDHSLVIETVFSSSDHEAIIGQFLLLPDPGSLTVILERLGVDR
ncbi:MAG: chemotaxis protein CheC [Syntrophomonadaceae bacterium]|nr:chemotaxis protein CheC [Syntrophomonadaceae bacterium]